ncbi:MAG: hypothetical protein JWL77_4724 [Chthonomonadaceae bacterium]|nr:hypothetical protein [Chthonomonadaceae bacterium]
MEGFYCEVIGCCVRACWKYLPLPDSCREDYLCSSHWETLRLRDPYHAGLYIHLSSLLAEGMEISSGSDTYCVVQTLQPEIGATTGPDTACC